MTCKGSRQSKVKQRVRRGSAAHPMNMAKKVIQRSRLNPGGDSAYAGRHTTPLSASGCECSVGAEQGDSMSVKALSQQVLQQIDSGF